MELILLKLVLFATLILSVSANYKNTQEELDSCVINPEKPYKPGDRYFCFPGDDDSIHLVDTRAPVDWKFIKDWARNPKNNKYWLYTRDNPHKHQLLVINDTTSVSNSNFNFKKDTVFTSHGWLSNGSNLMNQLLVKAFLKEDDVNVIVLDWSELAGKNYVTAKKGVPAVGKGLGQFINWLVTLGASYDRVHLVGHSLGGHLVGNAGRATGGKVKRITALDPAKPLWQGDEKNKLNSTDAQYVEVIHTDTKLLGYKYPLGDADFYPNGGRNQPGCISVLGKGRCSHSRAYELMAATVEFNHLQAKKCENYKEALENKCTGFVAHMGNSDIEKSLSGIFRGDTKEEHPY